LDDHSLTIGQVAKRAGLNVSAIRYYEAQGLLPEAPRVSGHRRYGEDTLGRLGVIDVAKRAGFTLNDIRVLLSASDDGQPAHEQVRALAQRKLPDVEELIERAQRVRGWLETAQGCGCETLDVCALFTHQARLPEHGLHVVAVKPGAARPA
jgi:MerR family transcriptional regulator, redox-sensitive transcriptional activator SoxR